MEKSEISYSTTFSLLDAHLRLVPEFTSGTSNGIRSVLTLFVTSLVRLYAREPHSETTSGKACELTPLSLFTPPRAGYENSSAVRLESTTQFMSFLDVATLRESVNTLPHEGRMVQESQTPGTIQLLEVLCEQLLEDSEESSFITRTTFPMELRVFPMSGIQIGYCAIQDALAFQAEVSYWEHSLFPDRGPWTRELINSCFPDPFFASLLKMMANLCFGSKTPIQATRQFQSLLLLAITRPRVFTLKRADYLGSLDVQCLPPCLWLR